MDCYCFYWLIIKCVYSWTRVNTEKINIKNLLKEIIVDYKKQ